MLFLPYPHLLIKPKVFLLPLAGHKQPILIGITFPFYFRFLNYKWLKNWNCLRRTDSGVISFFIFINIGVSNICYILLKFIMLNTAAIPLESGNKGWRKRERKCVCVGGCVLFLVLCLFKQISNHFVNF